MSDEGQMYETVIQNWKRLEKHYVKKFYGHEDEETYFHVIGRVFKYFLSDELKSKIPEEFRGLYTGNEEVLNELFVSKSLVPSSPILKNAGIPGEGNLFSYYIADTLDDLVAGSALTDPGVEFGYLLTSTDETSDGVEKKIENISRSPYINLSILANSNTMKRFVDDSFDVLGVTFLHNLRNAKLVAEEVEKGRPVNITFAHNIKKNTIVSEILEGYHTTANPGYAGPKNSACPMFYINLDAIMNNSSDFEDYLKKVNVAGYHAALLANLVIFSERGYVKENKYRPIGVGIMGLHAAMIRCDVMYESDIALEFTCKTQASLTLGTMAASGLMMCNSPKNKRIGQNAEYIKTIVANCLQVTSDIPQEEFKAVNFIKKAIETHGCLYNLTTTVQGYDPNLAGLVGVSTEGIDPLLALEMHRNLEEDENIVLFPLEIFDSSAQVTCDLRALKEQTFPYISPFFKVKIINTVQAFSHSPVASWVVLPADVAKTEILPFMKTVANSGLYTLKIAKGNHKVLKRTYKPKNEVSGTRAVENKGVTPKTSETPPDLPCSIGEEQLPPIGNMPIEVVEAKVYKLVTPNLDLHITVTDDGQYVMIDAPTTKEHDTHFSISKSLSQLTIRGNE